MSIDLEKWEIVVGLEVHAELSTKTKLFSSATNEFGGEPNTHIDPLTLGLPGSLPVLNEHAVELAIRAGLALNCTVQRSVFARKNYFYPDLPKDYQISQFDLPIDIDGWIELPSGKIIGIERAHLEEDTGKSTHIGGGRIHDANYSLVDYNRAGVPLLEIVGRPDIRSADEARDYVSELRSILVAVGASDGKMEEGSIKNVNSLRSMGRAIEYEAARQIDLLESGDRVRQETRHWNEADGRTHTLRVKEEADDYRYFPCPDLVAVDPGPEWIERVRAALPMLPRERRHRLAEACGVVPAEAALVVDRGLDDLCLAAIASAPPALAAWLAAIAAGAQPLRTLTHAQHNLADDRAATLDPAMFAKLVNLEVSGALTATQAKSVLATMVESGGDPADIAAASGFEAMDNSELEGLIDQLIADHPAEFARFCEGDGKIMGFFVGAVMKATKGKADGKIVTSVLNSRKP